MSRDRVAQLATAFLLSIVPFAGGQDSPETSRARARNAEGELIGSARSNETPRHRLAEKVRMLRRETRARQVEAATSEAWARVPERPSQQGELNVAIGEETRAVPERSAYRVEIDPEEQGPRGAGAAEAGRIRTPFLGGYALFTTTYRPGQFSQIGTVFTPVLLVPFANQFLIETKLVLDGEHKRNTNSGQWDESFGKNFEYIQLDCVASRYLTVIAGRYLTPFGIFNERQHAPWIKKLQIQPFISTGAPSGNGGMLKGASEIGSGMQMNYAVYFSALSTAEPVEARRAAGYRFGLAFADHRLEFGTSFQRVFENGHSNGFGFDLTWLPMRAPVEFRAEYASTVEGSGYWVEAGYRFWRKSEAVVRMEQFLVPRGFNKPVNRGPGGNLPILSTRRPMAGWNYYFRDGLKLGVSYGREFTERRDGNVWNVALAYRFR